AAAPDRTDGVDHVTGGETKARGDARVARRAAADLPAGLEQLAARGAMDGAVHAAAAEQRRVGGVDDRVDVLLRDVAPNRLDECRAHGRGTLLHRLASARGVARFDGEMENSSADPGSPNISPAGRRRRRRFGFQFAGISVAAAGAGMI